MNAPTVSGVILRTQQNKKNTHLYLDIHDGTKRKREFLRLYLTGDRKADRETMLLAEQIRTQRLNDLHLQRSGVTPITYGHEKDFLVFYKSLAQEKGKPWQNTLKHLERSQPQRLRFADIDADWIHSFRDYLKKQKLAPNSVATYLDTIKTSLNIAVRNRLIQQNPFLFADKIQRKRSQRVYLTIDELRVLFETQSQHPEVKRAFLFACFTGLRISDLRALQWKNIKEDGLHIIQRKTSDYTHIPLSTQANTLLDSPSVPNPKNLVFSLPTTDDLFNRYLKRWIKSAGIEKNVSSHIARHTFATLLITQGNDLYSVQHLLGHRDIKVTQVYAKLVDERKLSAINSLPLL